MFYIYKDFLNILIFYIISYISRINKISLLRIFNLIMWKIDKASEDNVSQKEGLFLHINFCGDRLAMVFHDLRNADDRARIHSRVLGEAVFTSQRLSPRFYHHPLPLPSTLLHSIPSNPRCWYWETRWSASNQRQDPSSSFASSYS